MSEIRRRDVVTALGGLAAWPLASSIAARAQQAGSPPPSAARPGLQLPPDAARALRAGLDPRLTPARGDIAAKHLAGVVDAKRFVEGKPYEIAAAQAPMRETPAHDAALLTEALKGERLIIYDLGEDGWAWGQLATDGYVGYLPVSALSEPGPAPTHKVAVLRTFVFPGPSIKLAPVETLSFASRLAIVQMDETFAVTAAGGHVPASHLVPIQTKETDFVAVAERFLGTPYLWGGKTSLGLDCSALVQLALEACGHPCLRDSDMQERALGFPLAVSASLVGLQRGDLLFWTGHVAIARDDTTLVHANAHHMAVAIEPTASAIERIRAASGEGARMRRLPARA
jgi:cell wall-associated NlpC family hydrolase